MIKSFLRPKITKLVNKKQELAHVSTLDEKQAAQHLAYLDILASKRRSSSKNTKR